VIDNQYLSQFESFKGFIRRDISGGESIPVVEQSQDSTPQEQIDRAFGDINTALADEIINEIMNLSPAFFEKLVVKLLVSRLWRRG